MSETDAPEAETPQLRETVVAPVLRPLAEILERLPTAPGVYLMKDRRGKIIYIGKAASLRTRVRQYFQPNTGDIRDFVPLLEGIVGDIETVVTTNEKEALLLENTLIKKHQPRFNVKLRDDKSYLVLRLDPKAEWPRLEVTRKIRDDDAHHFGPYHSATSCREALRVVNRHFQLRTCTDHVLHNRKRPCLQYQIKRCPAPCVLPVARDEYGDQVRDVRLFLEGKSDELLDRLRARMKEASTKMEFERAALVRDQIRALEATLEAQRVVSTDFVDQDVIGFHRQGLALEIAVITIRQGQMAGSRTFSFGDQEFPDAEILSSFLGLYYDLAGTPPDEVLLPFSISDADVKAEWLTELRRHPRGRKVEVLVPQRGSKRDLVELARKNAAASFVSRRNAQVDAEATLAKLQRRLRLSKPPRVIECYDISHVQGTDTVASMVVFVDGKPEKARYRTYKIQRAASPGRSDDFASMYEVLSRRFRRGREAEQAAAEAAVRREAGASAAGDTGAEESAWRLPDLLVVDGGKGQLGMALAAARDVGIDTRPGTGLTIIALAKEREFAEALPAEVDPEGGGAPAPEAALEEAVTEAATPERARAALAQAQSTAPPAPAESNATGARGRAGRTAESKEGKDRDAAARRPDRVFLPHAKDPIPIRPSSAEMFILSHLRDEAHRFAVTFHRNQRKRRTLRSALSDVPGIGETRQRALLRHFGSVRKIREASIDELAAVDGMSRKSAEAVFAHFAAQPDPTPAPAARGTRAEPSNEAEDEALEEAVEGAFAAVEDEAEALG